MVRCVCGKEFATLAGTKQHIRRGHCRGPEADAGNVCQYCNITFGTFIGLRQHQKQSHPVEYNLALEEKYLDPAKDYRHWTEEEVIRLAKAELAFDGHFINQHLLSLYPERSLESIKSKRRSKEYKEFITSLRLEKGLDVASTPQDLIETIEENVANSSIVLPPHDTSNNRFSNGDEVENASHNASVIEESIILGDVSTYRVDPPISELSAINEVREDYHLCSLDPLKLFLLDLETKHADCWDDQSRTVFDLIHRDTGRLEQVRKALDALITDICRTDKCSDNKRRRSSFLNHDGPGDIPLNNRPNRTFLFKRVQRLYKADRTKLANLIIDDKSVDDISERPSMEVLENKFRTVFEAPSSEDVELLGAKKTCYGNMYRPIGDADLQWALDNSKSMSAGPDRIRITHARRVPPRRLLLLFNSMLLFGIVPDILKANRTIFIPKGVGTADPNNWRPITISSVLLRLCNKIIGKRFAEEVPFHSHQRGFLRIDGVFLNTMTLESVIMERRRKRKPYHIISLDLQKAFDSVSHQSIRRALQRFSIDERLQHFILDGYDNSSTVPEIGAEHGRKISFRRGVKQGDPLSPYLFNLMLDELICILQSRNNGIPLAEGLNLSVLGYADDLILFADSIKAAQTVLRYTIDFFDKRGLSLNPRKCVALSVNVVPSNKTLYAISRSLFYIKGTPVNQLQPDEFFKYLGGRYNLMGRSKPLLEDLKLQLLRIKAAPLKPAQKFTILKLYLLPRYIHALQSPRVTWGILKETDKSVRIFVRQILHLNRTCTDAFIHAPVREGGLGVLSMRSLIPATMRRRITNLAAKSDAVTATVLSLSNNEKLWQKLLKWTQSTGGNRSAIARDWSDKLQLSYSGNGLNQGKASPFSGYWVNNPPTFWSGADFVKAVQLRGNLLPTKGIPSNPPHERKCRAGCDRTESLSHVLQRCPVTHASRIKRHDRLVAALRKAIERKGWIVETEPRIRCQNGVLKIPDLVCYNDSKVVVCDVAVSWEGPNSLSQTANHKIGTYNDPLTVQAVRAKYANRTPSVFAIVVGARGVWCPDNRHLWKFFGLSKREATNLILYTIESSIISYKTFMRSTYVQNQRQFGRRTQGLNTL